MPCLTGPGRVPFNRAAADILERFRPKVVSFHFGLARSGPAGPREGMGQRGALLGHHRGRGALAGGLRSADAIIAQGVEAGGHRGMFLSDDLTTQAGTFALVPQIVAAVSVPVIAAGGIADAAGVAAAMALGASGVQVGTAFLCCPEATTSALHRAALQSEAAHHTALTHLFTGRPRTRHRQPRDARARFR